MPTTSQNIINALRNNNEELTADEWRRIVEFYPYCEVFVWHYLRELYRGDDVMFESELERLGIRLGDRQGFYNFMTQPKEKEASPFEYNNVSDDYFASQGVDVMTQSMSLTEMARRLREARLARAQSSFCTEKGKKNDIETEPNEGKEAAEEVKKEDFKAGKGVIEADKEERDEEDKKAKETERLRVTQAEVTRLIQQKKYSEALEILRRENFVFSKKNSYFAVQIKYLETIINNNRK